MFDISQATVSRDVNVLLELFHIYFSNQVRWPSDQEWTAMMGFWPEVPKAVGCIDGFTVEIERPTNDAVQRCFYCGLHHIHCMKTQVITDVEGKIRYIETGYFGRRHDAYQYHQMPGIGQGQLLSLPAGALILGDKAYPLEYPILTPWRRNEFQGPDAVFRK